MDRRRFLLKTGQISAALTVANAPLLSGMESPVRPVRAGRNGSITLANDLIAWNLEWRDAKLSSTSFENKLSGRNFRLSEVQELKLTFSSAEQRIEIPWWKFQFGSDKTSIPSEEEQGFRLGYHRAEFQDKAWEVTENLLLKRFSGPKQRYQDDIRYDGYGWFRKWLELPATSRDKDLHFVLGGWDQQDWNDYWVYMNGEEIAHRSAQGRWRTPGIFKIAPGDPAYSSLHFGSGEKNLLAVRTRGFNKRQGGLSDEVLRHYVFEPFWVDQFLTVGSPYLPASDFEVQTVSAGPTQAMFELSSSSSGVHVALHYELDGPTRRKWAQITNAGDKERLLLDVQLDDFATDLSTSEGGAGEPVFLGQEAFAAFEHPTGLNQGDNGRIRLVHFPGRTLPAGSTARTHTALLSVAPPGEALEQFHDYIQSRSPRKQQALSLYTP